MPRQRNGWALAGLRSNVEPKQPQIHLRSTHQVQHRERAAPAQGQRLTLRPTRRAYTEVRRRARFEQMSMEFFVFALLHEWFASDAAEFGPNGYDDTKRGLWDALERMALKARLPPGVLVARALDIWAADL